MDSMRDSGQWNRRTPDLLEMGDDGPDTSDQPTFWDYLVLVLILSIMVMASMFGGVPNMPNDGPESVATVLGPACHVERGMPMICE